MRILIVDDDHDHAESISDVLAMRHHQVDLAFSGEDGVAKFRETPFEIVFMDVKLPGINGVEAFFECKKIRPSAKIMLMTGYSLEQLVARALAGGALGVLRKPFAMDEMLDILVQMAKQISATPDEQNSPTATSQGSVVLH